jgi:ABC-type phosphonate transport system ATPase subunit
VLRVEVDGKVMDGEGEGHGRSWMKRQWAEVLVLKEDKVRKMVSERGKVVGRDMKRRAREAAHLCTHRQCWVTSVKTIEYYCCESKWSVK